MSTPAPNDSIIRPHPGLYEKLLDAELQEKLSAHPELSAAFGKLDDEESPYAYSQFVAQILSPALRNCTPSERLALVNRLIKLIAATDGLDYLRRRTLLAKPEPVLLALQSPAPGGESQQPLPRPDTTLAVSSLLTGARHDPPLEHELRQEMLTADRVDILVSFIKWSGLRLLQPALEELAYRGVPVRLVTTSYMGASDPTAIAWLARQPGFSVRVSYDTARTRLHAKAYHFHRKSGYSSGYIGSANMSQAAMTSGLEWTVKVTQQDLPHILERFAAEFTTYWNSTEFEAYDESQAGRLADAISHAKAGPAGVARRFFVDLRPHSFQERILEALVAARSAGQQRNLVVAATGTGKTVIAAFDYARSAKEASNKPAASKPNLLFIAHRKEILEQARECFQIVLRDPNFGELLVGGQRPTSWKHVFASVQSLTAADRWSNQSKDHFRFIILDEAHHIAAASYRPILEHYRPEVLLGLTATPERMDGSSILPDFGGQFTAEIRLTEALEEKLLCPFHYFGVSDPVSLSDDRFWKSGKYDTGALTEIYTGDDLRARQRLDVILSSLDRYQPDLSRTRAVGFCASVKHARFMTDAFNEAGLKAAVIVGDVEQDQRDARMREFREGRVQFVFTVDVFNEGIDVPEINLVLFLRPTESLTTFLQQLGRGLRHHPEKECLTVLDFIGQSNRRYRIDRKFAALLTRERQRIDQEVERDFPHLPPGCNIQLERVAREHILSNIRESLRNLTNLVTESLSTFEQDHSRPRTFGNFVRATGISPLTLLKRRTWSEWKALADKSTSPSDPNLDACRRALRRVALRTDPASLNHLADFAKSSDIPAFVGQLKPTERLYLHYLLWAEKAANVGVTSVEESLQKWGRNSASRRDLIEVVEWRKNEHPFPTANLSLPFACSLRLHAAYGSAEIKAALELCSLESPGPTGVGVMHSKHLKTYVHLVTFKKTDQDFSPTTQYRDYPQSRTLLHWESQSTTNRASQTGQNYLNFESRGYTILFFARVEKRTEGETVPFIFLGPAKSILSAEDDRPIKMVWELEHRIPAALFEEARAI